VSLTSALDDRRAKQVLENVSPSGRQGNLQRHHQAHGGLKMIKSLFMNLIGASFFKALAPLIFRSKTNSISDMRSTPPAINLQGAITAQQECKSLGPQIKLPAKRCLESVVVLLIFHTRRAGESLFFIYRRARAASRETRTVCHCACQLEGGRIPLHTSAHAQS
jgi:hypothetical protein